MTLADLSHSIILSSERTCPDSFSHPSLSKAPRLAPFDYGSSSCFQRDPVWTCGTLPNSDLERSQYLWPSATIGLERLSSNAHMGEEYKRNLRGEFESSNAFRHQFLLFVAQMLHEQVKQHQPQYSLQIPSLLSSFISAQDAEADSASFMPLTPTFETAITLSQEHASRQRSSFILDPPRPRVSSRLSDSLQRSPLPGPTRRPMPRSKGRDACLLRQALRNTEKVWLMRGLGPHDSPWEFESQRKPAEADGDGDVVMACSSDDEWLSRTWVVVPCEDWDIVDRRELVIC